MLSEEPTYPLELKRKFASRYQFTPATITFYVVLYKLRREGLVESFPQGGRTLYRCTAQGREALQKGVRFISQIAKTLELG